MSEELYNQWKVERAKMLESHRKLLGYNTKAGIGLSGNVQIEINELEAKIQEVEAKIKEYEKGNNISSPQGVPTTEDLNHNKLIYFMEKLKNPSLILVIALLASITVIYFKGGEWNFNGFSFKTDNTKTEHKALPIILDTATITGIILTNDEYLKSEKINRIYFSHEFLNEGSVDNGGVFMFRNLPIPPDKLIKLMIDFKGNKRGESKTINISQYKKNTNGVYQLENPVNITKSDRPNNENSNETSKKNSHSEQVQENNSGTTIIFSPTLNQTIN